ncbi:MAG: thioredoxin fold domain-containing protein [Flavobacteriales bacterium]|nr:thioredoxin fold domain-containing protein [Flavobacteriales bacterium]
MKKFTIIFMALAMLTSPLLSTGQGGQGEINWMTLEEAVEAQKKNPKKIMMDVYTKWCGPCKMLDKNTFHHADVAAYVNKNYYPVKFDAEHPDPIVFNGQTYSNPNYVPNKAGRNGVHELSRAMGVSAYPTIVFLDEQQQMIIPLKGYKTPQDLELYLKFFYADEHKNVTTQEQWEAYRNNFTATW